MKLSITDARKLGIVAAKGRKSPHYADVARAKGKVATQWREKLSAGTIAGKGMGQ